MLISIHVRITDRDEEVSGEVSTEVIEFLHTAGEVDVELGAVVGWHRALKCAHRDCVEELATLQERCVHVASLAHKCRLE